MPRWWVINASPVIALARAEHILLSQELCEEMAIPAGAAHESNGFSDESDPARLWVSLQGKAHIQQTGRIGTTVLDWGLGLGESVVLAWANERPGWGAIPDDKVARNCAAILGIRVRGTLGIILMAKRENKIKSISSLLDQVHKAGFRIDPRLSQEAKRLAGEPRDGKIRD